MKMSSSRLTASVALQISCGHPYSLAEFGGENRSTTSPASPAAACLAATPIGATDLVSHQLPADRGARTLCPFLRDELKVECPTGSGKMMTLREVAFDLTERLSALFSPDAAAGVRGTRRALVR